MALSKAVGSTVQAATNTTVVVSGLGFAPLAIVFSWTILTADGAAADCASGMGFACYNGGAPTQHGIFTISDDANTDTVVNERITASDCILLTNPTGTVLGLADVSVWGADGFTLNWTSVDGTQRIVNYVALGGADLTGAKSGATTRPITTPASQAVTGMGFQPKALLVLCASDRGTALDASSALTAGWTLGWGLSSTARACAGWNSRGARTTDDNRASQRTDLIAQAWVGGTIAAEADLTSLDADGFTLNWTTVNARAGYYLYLGLAGADLSFAVGAVVADTDLGAQAITGAGFQPELVILQSWGKVASTSAQASGRHAVGVAASSTARGVIWAGGNQGAAETVEDSYLDRDKVMVFLTEGTPTLDAEADFTSFDADGFTLDWTDATAVAAQMLWFAMKGAAAGGGTVTRAPAFMLTGIG